MTSTESSIVNKLTTEIDTAAGDARSKLINDLWTVLGAAEKRIKLEAPSLLTTLEGEAKAVVGAVESGASTLLHKAEGGV